MSITLRVEMIFDSSSVKMLCIKLLIDNNVASRGFWLNESAFDILGITEDTETFEYGIGNPRILGIVKDFVIGDLVKSGKKGILLVDINDNYPYVNNILVEIQGNLANGYRAVKKAVEGISPETEFKGMYIEDQIKAAYSEQMRIQTIMVVFSIIAIIISSLGMLAISTYFAKQCSREIAVRKVFGATRLEVLTLIILKFIRLSVVAFVIACPIIWYAMTQWLSDFSYRIDMSIWILLAAGLFNLVIAFFAVYWQSNRTANTNPIDVIHQ